MAVGYSKILIYPIFYLLEGDYNPKPRLKFHEVSMYWPFGYGFGLGWRNPSGVSGLGLRVQSLGLRIHLGFTV